MALHPIHILKI